MISIDTSIMRSLVAASTAANEAITDAMDVLNRITTHNDWTCREKDAINEYTSANRSRMHQLQDNAAAFLHAITGAAEEFEETEGSIWDMFSSVEPLITDILSSSFSWLQQGTCHPGGEPLTALTPGHFSHTTDFDSLFNDGIQAVAHDHSNFPFCRQGDYNSFEAYTLCNLDSAIGVCSFSDIDLG